MKINYLIIFVLVLVFIYLNGCGVVTPAKKSEREVISKTQPKNKTLNIDTEPVVGDVFVTQYPNTGQVRINGKINLSYIKKSWKEWEEVIKYTN